MNGAVVLEEPVGQLRAVWEETSFQLERLQAEPRCVAEEEQGLRERTGPSYCLPPTFPRVSVPHEPGEGLCAIWASPALAGMPGPAQEKVGGGRDGALCPGHPSSPQVAPCPELPSCERRAVMETVRWQMPSTWPGLR